MYIFASKRRHLVTPDVVISASAYT